MKKIFKITAVLIGTFLFTGNVHAQLSSDKPAMTVQQVKELQQRKVTDPKTVTTAPVNDKSNQAAAVVTTASGTPLNGTVKTEPVKMNGQSTSPDPAVAATSQGNVKPAITEIPTVTKQVPVPVQSDKPVGTKQ